MGSVTAAIKSVWHSAPVFERQDVFEQSVPLRPHQIEQREHVRPTLIRCSSGLDFTRMQLPTETIDGVSELGVFRGLTGRYDFPECGGLRRRRFGIKAGNVDRVEVGRHMLVAAVLEPSDEIDP